jgi:hypothetical protein
MKNSERGKLAFSSPFSTNPGDIASYNLSIQLAFKVSLDPNAPD